MKEGIHPEYKPATITCSCGNTIETRSTQEEIHVEICAVCHPFYTGRQKLVDTAGRVERFKRKYGDMTPEESEESEEGGEAEAEASGDEPPARAAGAEPEGESEGSGAEAAGAAAGAGEEARPEG